jgi:RNA polymerase sigma factor (sigma-70 family)
MVHTFKHTDAELIEKIKNNDAKTIRQIYASEFGRIKSMVLGFKNLQLDAEDIFQEGLTRAVINIRKGEFKGESTFSTYLYGICRNLCLKEYNRNKPYLTTTFRENRDEDVEPDHFDLLHLVLHVKQRLSEECRTLFNLRFGLDDSQQAESGMRFEEIARKLGINAASARQKFKRCLDKLKTQLKEHPLFHELTV